ncbi:hypothetical protein HLA99_12420 [Microbacterium ulmi]|uniref:Adhesin n=1 Tax=Microbacterium ulmi TaxID=179095 RepID=A0A7Y2M1E0_9MICO|nr:hypothetical protein [Microbacterium ulmi]
MLLIVFGGIILLGTIGSAVVSTLFAASVHTSTRTLAVGGVEALDVDLAAGSLRIEFADVDEAELQVTSSVGADRWTLRRDGDELTVGSPRFFGSGWLFGGSGDAVLRLPESLEALDAELGISAGEITADGAFGDVQLEVGAGRAELSGSARAVSVDLSAGRADVDLADVSTADLGVSAGDLVASFTGAQPRTITVDVSAGSLTLTVPDGRYDVSSDVSAGRFDNRVGSTPGAESTVDVTVSAGNATLRPGD